MENKKVLLSVKDLEVKFHVRSRVLTAIRGIDLDIYENESIAIVGESGSGKSVFTKTFAGMLETNGFISNGSIIFNDPLLEDTSVALTPTAHKWIRSITEKLNESSKLELGAATNRAIIELKAEGRARTGISDEERAEMDKELEELNFQRAEAHNLKLTIDASMERQRYHDVGRQIADLDARIKALEAKREQTIKDRKTAAKNDTAYLNEYHKKLDALEDQYYKEIHGEITQETRDRNLVLAKEIYLSVGRHDVYNRMKLVRRLLKSFRKAMALGVDLYDENVRNAVFEGITLRVRLEDETPERLHGTCILNLATMKYAKDWSQIRGSRIATVFQDPMTSLNPIITIGKQITSIILKHQKCSEVEARERALVLMKKVGIPNAENRFDDYPFQYSGGMRQRIVIAIALSCQPKVLICDEPTTALDVTIQAQILKLLKDLQKEFNYTIVFITHDLGVVANIADRVAVMYAGQIVELGTVEDVFYNPQHPYTWALLSSLPQLAQKNTILYSITGTPPSLYNKIVGDPFAPRNPYCLKIDTLKEPPMFQVSETHFAKTWLLDPRAPKVEKPEIIQDIHGKLLKAFNI